MSKTAKVLDDSDYIASIIYGDMRQFMTAREAFASCAIEGNDIADRCCKTIDRLLEGQRVTQTSASELASMFRNIFHDKTKESGSGP